MEASNSSRSLYINIVVVGLLNEYRQNYMYPTSPAQPASPSKLGACIYVRNFTGIHLIHQPLLQFLIEQFSSTCIKQIQKMYIDRH